MPCTSLTLCHNERSLKSSHQSPQELYRPPCILRQPLTSLRPQICLGYSLDDFPSQLPFCTKNPPCTPLASHNTRPFLESSIWVFFGTLSHSRRCLLVRPYPLFSTLNLLPWKTGISRTCSDLAQIPRPHLGHVGPLAVLTMYIAKETIGYTLAPLALPQYQLGKPCATLGTLPTWTLLKSSHRSPWELYTNLKASPSPLEALGWSLH